MELMVSSGPIATMLKIYERKAFNSPTWLSPNVLIFQIERNPLVSAAARVDASDPSAKIESSSEAAARK